MAETQSLLVYRDRIGAPSETGFLRRQYVGFTRLRPVWIGRTVRPGGACLGADMLRLGGDGPAGVLRRLLFRHLGLAPPLPLGGFAPVLHAQFARGGALALPLSRAYGLRLFVTLHGGDVSKRKNWGNTVLARRWPDLLREAVRLICVSEAVAAVAAARGAPAAKITVLPIGVEIPYPPPPLSPRHLLFVGRFVEKKGVAVLAQAVRRLRALGDRTPVVCVGEGPLRPALEGLARDAGAVTLTGWQSPPAVRLHMRSAIALLVPSIVAGDGDAEGLPSVIPEAMSLGVPVIGSGQGGIAEAIRHDGTGLLVPPGDPAALAEAMRRLTTDPARAAALGGAARADAARRLNARIQSARLEELLLSA